MFSVEGRVGQRKLWGIVHLAQRHPRQIVNAACAQALDDGVYSYRHVKLVTEKRVSQALQQLEQAACNAGACELQTTQSHDLIRSPQEYGELFAQAAATAAATNQGDLLA